MHLEKRKTQNRFHFKCFHYRDVYSAGTTISRTMPSTNFHPMLNMYILSKVCKINLRSPAMFYCILWGSMVPDFSLFVFFFYYILIGTDSNEIWSDLYFTKSGWITVKNYLHSIPVALFLSLFFFILDHSIRDRANRNPKNSEIDSNGKAMESSDVEIGNLGKTPNLAAESSASPLTKVDVHDDDNWTHDINCRNCWCNTALYVVPLAAYWFLSMFLHSIADFLLHHDDAHSSLVPFTNWKFQSPVSYYDTRHYGYFWVAFELGFSLYFMYWILKIKGDDWKDSKYKWLFILWIIIFVVNVIWFFLNAMWCVMTLVST